MSDYFNYLGKTNFSELVTGLNNITSAIQMLDLNVDCGGSGGNQSAEYSITYNSNSVTVQAENYALVVGNTSGATGMDIPDAFLNSWGEGNQIVGSVLEGLKVIYNVNFLVAGQYDFVANIYAHNGELPKQIKVTIGNYIDFTLDFKATNNQTVLIRKPQAFILNEPGLKQVTLEFSTRYFALDWIRFEPVLLKVAASPVTVPAPTPTPTPTPAPEYDADALAYFTALETAGGTLTTIHKEAINQFVVTTKNGGYWDLLADCGLFLGGSLASAAVKLKGLQSLVFVNLVTGNLTSLGVSGSGTGYIECTNSGNATPTTGVSILTRVTGHSITPYFFVSLGGAAAGISQHGQYAILYQGIGGAANGNLSGNGNFWLVGGSGTNTSKAYKGNTEIGSLFVGASWLLPNPNTLYFMGLPSDSKAPNTVTLGGFLVIPSALPLATIEAINSIWENLMIGLGK